MFLNLCQNLNLFASFTFYWSLFQFTISFLSLKHSSATKFLISANLFSILKFLFVLFLSWISQFFLLPICFILVFLNFRTNGIWGWMILCENFLVYKRIFSKMHNLPSVDDIELPPKLSQSKNLQKLPNIPP